MVFLWYSQASTGVKQLRREIKLEDKKELARIAIKEAADRIETINRILKSVNDEYEAEKEVLQVVIEKNDDYLNQTYEAAWKRYQQTLTWDKS